VTRDHSTPDPFSVSQLYFLHISLTYFLSSVKSYLLSTITMNNNYTNCYFITENMLSSSSFDESIVFMLLLSLVYTFVWFYFEVYLLHDCFPSF